jgi:nicotinamide mononucleotide transporter
MNNWLMHNYIELFGALAGIIYVFLEIRQTIWLWPVGLITSAIYVWIFFSSKLYADMSLQAYYVVISILGWYWWMKGAGQGAGSMEQGARGKGQGARGKEHGARSMEQGLDRNNSPFEEGQGDASGKVKEILGDRENNTEMLQVTRLKTKTGFILSAVFVLLYFVMWIALSKLTDSPVPGWDAFLTSLSIVATWMLARKIYEHWYLWIVVNIVSLILYFTRGLYPTVVLYIVYAAMSFIGLKAWKSTIKGIANPRSDNL